MNSAAEPLPRVVAGVGRPAGEPAVHDPEAEALRGTFRLVRGGKASG